MNYFIFISLLFVPLVHCRPQDSRKDAGVEIEKQTIVKLSNDKELLSNDKEQSRQLTSEEEQLREANTKEILEKIAQVNLNQGLTSKTMKRPFYSALQQKQQKESAKQLPNFQFSNTPMGNPIFEYLQRNQNQVSTKQATTGDDEEIPEGEKNKITYVPFYGGAKGQTLEITEFADGTVVTQIIQNNEIPPEITETVEPTEITDVPESDFSKEIKAIHQTAQNIIKLQATAKHDGQLSQNEQEKYNQQMEQLNLATRNLAQFQQMQQDDDIDEDQVSRANLRFWFEQKKNKLIGKQSEENQEETEEAEEVDEGVAINLPPEDASVAEAKPVGLAVAGIGGVAASKPIATAVVGPAGLAIARPVATAIAGVSPEDAMIPILADGYYKFPEKKPAKPSKENCDKGDKCGDKKKEEKPKQDYLTNYGLRNFEY